MKTKMAGLFALVMIALMVAGMAYVLWSETLTINGTVNTGTLDVSWSVGNAWDSEPPEKDVSSISGRISEVDPSVLIVTVENAYPCIDYNLTIDVHNDGSIPVIISGITVTPDDFPGTVEILPDNDPNTLDIDVGTQLERCDCAYGILHVHHK